MTSTARTKRPSAASGCGSPASTCRNRGRSTSPRLSASYIAPCPRRCSAVSVRSTGVATGPSAHSRASVSSNSVSPRTGRESKKSPRKRDATANASRRTSGCSRLIPPRPSCWSSASLVGAQDQTKAVFTSPESSYERSCSGHRSRSDHEEQAESLVLNRVLRSCVSALDPVNVWSCWGGTVMPEMTEVRAESRQADSR